MAEKAIEGPRRRSKAIEGRGRPPCAVVKRRKRIGPAGMGVQGQRTGGVPVADGQRWARERVSGRGQGAGREGLYAALPGHGWRGVW